MAKSGWTSFVDSDFQLGDWRVQPQSNNVVSDHRTIHLEPKVMGVLVCLAQRSGEVVPKEQLVQEVWRDTFVTDDVLIRCISELRKAFGDSAGRPTVIETIPKRGYRLLIPAVPIAQASALEANLADELADSVAVLQLDSANEPRYIETLPRRGSRFPAGVATRRDLPTPENEAGQMERVAVSSTPGAPARKSIRWIWFAACTLVILAFFLTWFLSSVSQPRVTGSTQITHDGLNKTNILSDGVRLYFTAFSGERYLAAQVSASGGETSMIPTSFQNVEVDDISPDRSLLLVASFSGAEFNKAVWSLPLPVGAPRRLAQLTGHCFTWSPDGRQLLFCKDSNLFLANSDGTEAHLLLSPADFPISARFSPDSKRIRVTLASQKTGIPAIWELNRDGSNLHRLLPDSGGRSGECCGRWTADGHYYIFIGANNVVSPDPVLNVFALPDVSGKLRRTSSVPVQLTAGPLSFKAVLPSFDGKRLFVLAAQQRAELVRYDTRTRQYVSFLSGVSATDVDFSRDGKWVTYITTPDGDLWRSRSDGTERVQLTYGPARPVLPRWSPDGSQVAYSAAQLHEPSRIFLISAQGGEPEQLLAEKYSEADPTWSPDGTQIAFGRMPNEDAPLVQIADVKTRQITIVPESAGLFSPRWSPDGRYLAALTADSKKLMRYDFARRKWFDWISGESIGYPSWSADSKYVYFDTALTELTSFRRVGIGQTHSEPLFSLTGLRRYVDPLGTWSGLAPNGSPLFVRDISTQEIYALDVHLP